MSSRLARAALVLALVTGMTTGCFAQPEPEDAPPFATEEEAFAAAEETYRAYVDALNQVDLSDPETFEDVYAWTTGEANAGARESFSQMHADGWVVSGQSSPTLVEALSSSGARFESVDLAVCVDVSAVSVTDESGESVVSEDRGNMQSMLVGVTQSESTPTGMIIESFNGREGSPECA